MLQGLPFGQLVCSICQAPLVVLIHHHLPSSSASAVTHILIPKIQYQCAPEIPLNFSPIQEKCGFPKCMHCTHKKKTDVLKMHMSNLSCYVLKLVLTVSCNFLSTASTVVVSRPAMRLNSFSISFFFFLFSSYIHIIH